MATEFGHAASRVYRDQAGDFHLNGAKFFNDAEADISDSLEELNSLAPTEIGYLDGALPGTATASKTAIYDSAGKLVKNVAAPAAAGNSQATATAITKNLNAVTGADGTKGVKLPIGAAGDEIVVINTDAAQVLKVYPETGGQINALGADAAISIGPGKAASFICTALLQWYAPDEATIVATTTELNLVDGAAAGTVAAGKAAVYDAGGRVVRNVANPAAAGVNQGDATALTTDLNVVTGADGAKGVVLPTAAAGMSIAVINTANAVLLVYPATGGQINALGANASFSQGAYEACIFVCTAALQWYTTTVTGVSTLARTRLAEDVLQPYGIPISALQQTTGVGLAAAETAGNFNVSVAANVISAQAEITDNETEVSVVQFQFTLPPEYVAAGDVKVRLPVNIVKTGAAVNNGSTIDVSAYEQSDAGAVGADICETAAQTFAAVDTWYNKDFVITAAGLLAGDVLNVVVTSSVVDSEAGAGTLRLNMAVPKMLADVKG